MKPTDLPARLAEICGELETEYGVTWCIVLSVGADWRHLHKHGFEGAHAGDTLEFVAAAAPEESGD